MESTRDFLLALGLDETAGVREVRRAYARRLKQIDQAVDPAAFQALREAYETALSWAEYREREERGDTVQATAVTEAAMIAAVSLDKALAQAAEADLPTAEQSAETVFERFGQDVARMADNGRLGDPQAWLAALEARLGEEELENIAVRTLFEERIAHLLAAGWQPGNEALFPAAVATFGWQEDRRRLALFGFMGAWLNQAIDERILFDTQPPVRRGMQERIAAMLRRAEPASDGEIFTLMDELNNIEARFPALLAVVAGTGKIEHWRQVHAARYLEGEPFGTSIRERLARWFACLVLLLALFFALHALYNRSSPTPLLRPDQPAVEARAEIPAPSLELLRPYLAPVKYTPTKPGKLSVAYEAYLLEDGSVNATDMIEPSSGDAVFDMAVAQAILDAKPFPNEVPRVFRIRYTYESYLAPAAPSD